MTTNNALCEFITQDNITFTCKNCGTVIRGLEPHGIPPVFVCSSPIKALDKNEPITPSTMQKIKNFAGALAGHVKTGMKMCTEEQIDKRFSICQQCEFFVNNTCNKCGCPLVREKKFISKLAWADQECPVGKWKKEI